MKPKKQKNITEIVQGINLSDKKVLRASLLLLLVVVFITYFIAPAVFNYVIYQQLILRIIIYLPLAYVVYTAVINGHQRRSIIKIVLMFVAWWIGVALYRTANDVNIYQNLSKFEKIDSLITSNPEKFRFTPKAIALSEIIGNWNESAYTINLEKTNPYSHNGVTGYIAPIVPHGLGAVFTRNVLGVVIYNDTPADVMRRDTIIKQEFEIGEGVYIRNNLYRNLCAEDRFSIYEDARYISLNKTNEIVTISPIIKYSFHLPFSLTPYWYGVAIVHSNGTIEILTKTQAIVDERLKNQWIAPTSLAIRYVNAQNSRAGFMPLFLHRATFGLYSISSLIEISDIDDGNGDYPHISISSDNKINMVVAVEPVGAGKAIKELYYLNGFDLSTKVYQFDPDRPLNGPEKAQMICKNLPGYLWKTGGGDKSSGIHVAIEPTELVKDHKLYWKLSVTTDDDKSKVNGDILIVDAEDPKAEKIKIFKTRSSFYSWLRTDNNSASVLIQKDDLSQRIYSTLPKTNRSKLIQSIKQKYLEIGVLIDSLDQVK